MHDIGTLRCSVRCAHVCLSARLLPCAWRTLLKVGTVEHVYESCGVRFRADYLPPGFRGACPEPFDCAHGKLRRRVEVPHSGYGASLFCGQEAVDGGLESIIGL